MKKLLSSRRARGQSTLEIIIAITVLAAGIIAAIMMLFGGQSISIDSQTSSIALRMAQSELELIESRSHYDFAGIVSASTTEGEFTRELIVEELDANTKEVTVRVSWRTDPLRLQNIELTTLITGWQEEEALGGDTGGGGLAGDWNNPRTLGTVNLAPPAGIQATDLDVLNKIIYISVVHGAESSNDFFVVNAEDGENPYIVANINTGSGLNALDAVLDYVFAAHNKISSQLQVIDATNKTNPLLVAELTLPGASGSGAVGWSLFFYNNMVYMGTKSATGPEFHIIDVSAPTSPVHLGSFEVGADINEIRVVGSTAFLATSDDQKELLMLDVSDPAAISEAGFLDAPGSRDAKSLFLTGTTLYLGRVTGQNDDLRLLDVSNPAMPATLGTVNIGHDVTGLVVRDYLVFMTTSASNEEFQVWNISDPANAFKVSGFNFPQVANGIDYEDNLVYVAVRSNDGLRIITSQ